MGLGEGNGATAQQLPAFQSNHMLFVFSERLLAAAVPMPFFIPIKWLDFSSDCAVT